MSDIKNKIYRDIVMDEFWIAFEKLRTEAKEAIEKAFEKTSQEMKVSLTEIKTEIEKLNNYREETNTELTEIKFKNKELEKDVNNLGSKLREQEIFLKQIEKVKWEIGLIKWLGGASFLTSLALVGKSAFELIKKIIGS